MGVRPIPPGPRHRRIRQLAAAAAIAAIAYLALVGNEWLCYGHPAEPLPAAASEALDRQLPRYEVVMRHEVGIAAPASLALATAATADLERSPLLRALFWLADLALDAKPDRRALPRELVTFATSRGWRILEREPGHELILGAVSRPWRGASSVRAVAADSFRAFDEPGYAKIVWALRADSIGPHESVFRSETRVMTTDADARRRFRWYWARFSPGLVLIRRATLWQLRSECEASYRAGS